MLTRTVICLLASLSFLPLLHAQDQRTVTTTVDSTRFIYGIDNRRTHIGQQQTLIYGAYLGMGLGQRLRLKAGINGTLFERGRFIDRDGLLDRNRLVFVSLGEEFDFFIRPKLRLTTYCQVGAGLNYFRALDTTGREVRRGRDPIYPLEMGLHGSYPIVSWARLKLGGGWRFVFPTTSYDLSGYYIKLGIGVDLKQLKIEWDKYRQKR